MLEETGLHTLYTIDCSNGESAHGAMEISRNRGSRALETTVASFNWANDVIPTGPNEAKAVEVIEGEGLVSQDSEANQYQ